MIYSKAGSPTASDTGTCPSGVWMPPDRETPQPSGEGYYSALHPQPKEFLLMLRRNLLSFRFMATAPRPAKGHQWKDSSTILLATAFQLAVCINEIFTPSPLRTKHAQLPTATLTRAAPAQRAARHRPNRMRAQRRRRGRLSNSGRNAPPRPPMGAGAAHPSPMRSFRAAQPRPLGQRTHRAGPAPRAGRGGLGVTWRTRGKRGGRYWRFGSIMCPRPPSLWAPSSGSPWKTFCKWAEGVSPHLSDRGLPLPSRRRGAAERGRMGPGVAGAGRASAGCGVPCTVVCCSEWGAGRHCCLGYESPGLSAQCRVPGAAFPGARPAFPQRWYQAPVGRAASACSLSLRQPAAKQRSRGECRRCS